MKNSVKKWSLIGLLTSVALAVGVIAFSHAEVNFSHIQKGDATEFTLTLDSANGYTSGTEQSIITDSGQYAVTFAYASCNNAASAHVLINDGGTLVNKDHIRSISKLQATYTGGTLKARTSYDKATWGEYFELTSGYEYSFGSYPYYVEFKAFENVTLTKAKFTYTCVENAAAHEGEHPTVETLLGVINFWNTANLNDTGTTNTANKDYIDTYSYKDTTFTTKASIITAATPTKAYQKRYGGIGLASSSDSGSLNISIAQNYRPNKVVVKTSAYLNATKLNNKDVTTILEKKSTDLANSTELEFNYETAQSTLTFTAPTRLAIYQIYFYNVSGGTPEYDIPKDEVGFTATDTNKDNYLENSIFDTAKGLSAVVNYSDGTSSTIASENYSYVVLNSSEQEIDTSKQFGSAGTYTLVVSYKSFIPQRITLEVGEYVYLTGVAASMTTTTFTTADILSNNLSGNLTAGRTFNYTKYNENNIAYSNFATKHLEVKLFNPSDTESSITSAFATPGSWKVRVRSTDDNSKYADVTITVNAISVTSVTLSSTATSVQEDKTVTLTATVLPNNATNKTVTWSTNAPSIATVDNGVVTGIKAGSAVITATANDGSGAYATCNVTVTAKPATVTATITVKTAFDDGATAIEPTTSDFTYENITVTSIASGSLFGTGEKNIKFSSSNNGGSLTFNFSSTLIVGVKLYLTRYDDNASVTVKTSANTTGQKKDIGENTSLVFDAFATDTTESTSLTISSASKNRFYLTKVEITCGAPTPVYPTSISLSGTSSINVGGNATLSVSYSPSNTNQKILSWESSNPAVATVENGVVHGVSAGSATITAKALKQDSSYATATKTITVNEQVLDPYTILIYMCGADLESGSGQATGDIDEILAANMPSDVNIVIETGGASSWKKYNIPSNKLGRYYVNGTSLAQATTPLTNASMGDPNTFRDFLIWGLENYPAQQTGVILWNHGGAMDGCCFDENYSDDGLTPSELYQAVSEAYTATGITKLDWIGYDCCLMSVADIASINADYFDYMIASEESEWGDGWAYDEWLPSIKNNKTISPADLLPVICDTFVEYYDAWGSSSNNQTLSVLDLSKMDAFISAFNDYATALSISSDDDWMKICYALYYALKFGIGNGNYYAFGIADFSSWLDEMDYYFSSVSSTELRDALDDLVIHNKYGGYYSSVKPCGLCVFIAAGVDDESLYYWGYRSAYPASATKFTVWYNINQEYGFFN